METKIKALLENEDFCKKLAGCKAAGDIKALFDANGVELSAEQAAKILSTLTGEGELSDDALEGVAGGVSNVSINQGVLTDAQKVSIRVQFI